ncbi:MAG: pyruvate kinase alpha/beta domain-containing protein, partial [Rikenellaceae bacterium]
VTAQLARSAVRSCVSLPIKAVIIDTLSGRTGRYMSAFRGQKPVYAICYKKNVMRELTLSYGIYAGYQEPSYIHRDFLRKEMNILLKNNSIEMDDMIVVVGGDYGAEHGASFMEISKVDELLGKLKRAR